jgi:hypothetical protein
MGVHQRAAIHEDAFFIILLRTAVDGNRPLNLTKQSMQPLPFDDVRLQAWIHGCLCLTFERPDCPVWVCSICLRYNQVNVAITPNIANSHCPTILQKR